MELAKRAGISQSFVHDLESGSKDATSRTLIKIAQALNVSVTELLEEERKPRELLKDDNEIAI